MHGTQTKQGHSSEDPPATKGELHFAKRDMNQLREGIKIAQSFEANAQVELSEARKTVKDLASRLDKQKRLRDGLGLFQSKTSDGQYAQVTRELENIKQELSKLKLDMDHVLEDKKNADTEIEASSSIILSYSSFAQQLRKNIDQLNEEHVLVALARIEALREYTEIESERNKKAREYLIVLEKTRKAVNGLNEEAATAQELEKELAVTAADVKRLKSELALIKKMDIRIPETAKLQEDAFEKPDFMLSLRTILEESEAANKELAAINDEGFQSMSSMDVIREELKQLVKEKARLRKTEEKAELTIQSVNSKLLRAKSKLEALSAAEEKADSMSSSLASTLKHLRAEAEAANKERALDLEEAAKFKAEGLRTKSEINMDEAQLQASIEELRAVKSSESTALETLKTLVEISMKAKAKLCQHNSKITISTCEYEYLKGRAVEAREVAEKKVEAAEAWTEALRSSEKEIQMETMITQRQIRKIGVQEEAMDFGRKHDHPEEVQFKVAPSRKSLNRYSISTPATRPRFRKSGSPAGFYMSRTGITTDRRRKGVQNISKFFGSNNLESDQWFIKRK